MTIEEAKGILEDLKASLDMSLQGVSEIKEIDNAIKMAIKNFEALEKMRKEILDQQPCDDCISRQATVERLCKVADFMNEKREGLGSPYIMAALFIQDNKEEFPSVTSKEKVGWIPVSEKLPEIHQDILLSLRSLDIEVGFRAEEEPYFYCHGAYIEPQNVLAWMPLPEPYKPQESEEV